MNNNNFTKSLLAVSLGLASGASSHLLYAAALEEVVVTAQKRAESIQDVSAAITAMTGDELTDGQIANVEDLQGLAPSVSVGNDFAQAKIFIRGIGLNSSFAGVDPSVALHVDGAVVSQSYAQLGSFFDLERVEILRGPQGTLYGRNATGGSFNLITRKPTEEFSGYGRFTVANYNKVAIEGAVSGPLSENVLGRLAYRNESRGGYGENIVTGNDIDDAKKQSMRGHLQFNINEDVDLLLSGEWHNEDDAGLALKFIDVASNVDPGIAGAPGVGGFAPGKRDIASEVDPQNDRTTWALTSTLTWGLNEDWTLKSITNYRDLDVLLVQDLDISSNINDDVQRNGVQSKQFSEELQLNYESEKLRGIVALFYFQEELLNRNNIGFASPNHGAGNTTAVLLTGDIDIETYALFANFSYDINDAFSVKLGGRYSYESREADNLFHLDFSHFGGTPFTTTYQDERSFNDFSPALGLDWRVAEEVLLYASYSEGFKSGTIQAGQRTPVLNPEEIENYELGLKGTFWDGQLRINMAAFRYEFTDLQLDRTRPNPDGSFTSIFENAAEADGQGFEIEMSLQASEALRINGYVGYLDTEFGEYLTDNPLDAGTNIQNLEGNALRQAPELSWGMSANYEVLLDSGAIIDFAADIAYRDEQYFTEFNQDITGSEDYTITNARIKYTTADSNLFFNFWAKNITDEEVYSGKFVIATGRTIGGSLLAPATYGVTVGYDF